MMGVPPGTASSSRCGVGFVFRAIEPKWDVPLAPFWSGRHGGRMENLSEPASLALLFVELAVLAESCLQGGEK